MNPPKPAETRRTIPVFTKCSAKWQPPFVLQDDSGDEEEQERVAQEVQLLMDCVADMVVHEGVQNMGQMTEAGMTLFPEHKPKFVRGRFPDHMGGGENVTYILIEAFLLQNFVCIS